MKIVCISKHSLKKQGYNTFDEWVNDPDNLYIGKKVNRLSIMESQWYNHSMDNDKYREYISEDIKNNISLFKYIKKLGCWCKDTNTCHGNVIIDIINENILSEKLNNIDISKNTLCDSMSKLNIDSMGPYDRWLWDNYKMTAEEQNRQIRIRNNNILFGNM